MCIEEVVGAIVGVNTVTTDPRHIESSELLGRSTEYITRRHAKQSPELVALASAPTLFVLVNGVRFILVRGVRSRSRR